MIEKFKTNAEVIENGDKYLYGNHVRMPISIERGDGAGFRLHGSTSCVDWMMINCSTCGG